MKFNLLEKAHPKKKKKHQSFEEIDGSTVEQNVFRDICVRTRDRAAIS